MNVPRQPASIEYSGQCFCSDSSIGYQACASLIPLPQRLWLWNRPGLRRSFDPRLAL